MKNTIILVTSIFVLAFWGCEDPDTTPPDISIASPVDGAIVSDTVTIKTVVADNDGINNVDFFLDGNLLATVTEEPFQTDWNTTESSNGEHTLQCKAVDNSDNETLSESIQVTVANVLFTANFTNDWLCPDCGEGIIFISDIDGNVLAEETWTGNESFEILPPTDITTFPEKISVTTLTSDEDGNVFMTSNLNIPLGSSWTWGKDYPSPDYDNTVTAEFDFQNIPDHGGYILSSLWSSRSSTSGILSSPYSFYFYESPMDIYLKLNTTDSGPKYLWVNNITGGNYQVDLSSLISTESELIDLQGSSVGFRQYLYGYPVPGSRYTGRYIIDRDYDYDSTVTSLSVYYPPSTFSDYRTSLYFYDTDDIDNFWYQATYGDIPNSFTKIEADFDFVSVLVNNFQISLTNSNFDEIRTSWRQSNDNYYISWYVYGPTNLSSYSLPSLSNSVIQDFPYVDRESFELIYTDLIEYSELSSYEEILDIIFNSTDYFYDVVNDFRARIKYYDSGSALLRESENALEEDDDYEIPYSRR